MSAIGDYIHYTLEGYKRHGTSRNGVYQRWADQKAWRKKTLDEISHVSDKTLTEIENLSKAISVKSTSLPLAGDIQNDITNYMISKFNKEFNPINFENMTVNIPDNTINDYIGRVQLIETKNGKQISTTMRTLINKIERLENIVKKMQSNTIEYSRKDIKELKDYIKRIKALYEETYGIALSGVKKFNEKKQNSLLAINVNSLIKLKNEMNRAIERWAAYPAISGYEGLLWESVLGATAFAANKFGYQTALEAIDKTVKGEENIKTEFNIKNFDPVVFKTAIGSDIKLDISQEKSARSKIDVSLEWNNEKVNISAKNITLHKQYGYASLVSGSPLLIMVQNMDANFVNHYLNCFALHGDKQEKYPDTANVKDDMTKNLMITALAGLHFSNKENMVNVFAVNDKSGGGIKLITVQNLGEKLEALSAQNLSIKLNDKRISEYYYMNKKQSTTELRLANFLKQLHSAKVHASFNVASALYS